MHKQILLIINITLLLLITIPVRAEELEDITNDAKIKYKWYIQTINEVYYPKGKALEGYIEIPQNITYGPSTGYDQKYCNYNPEYYLITKNQTREYTSVVDTQYIKLENFNWNNNVKIYSGTKNIDYTMFLEDGENDMYILKLNKPYSTGGLWFYITGDNFFDISMFNSQNLILKTGNKHIEYEGTILPDKTWINDSISRTEISSIYKYEANDFLIDKGSITRCRVSEILTYRYKITKTYYDDKYHDYIDGYEKDYNDYIIYYDKEQLRNTIEITTTKEEKVYVPEYIYIEKEVEPQTIESNSKETEKLIIKTNYQNKIIEKIPTEIYIAIVFLLITIIFLAINSIRLSRKICRRK